MNSTWFWVLAIASGAFLLMGAKAKGSSVPPGVDTISWDKFKSFCVQNGVLNGKQCMVSPGAGTDFDGVVIRHEANNTVSAMMDGKWVPNVDV